jgi:hypothetical protein
MDYLPIHASLVPCERAFSLSSETDTQKHNRISSTLIEALQMIKYHLKQQRLDFLAHWASPLSSLVEDEPEEPNNMGKKQDKAADILHSTDDLLQQIMVKESDGLAYIVIYK